MNFTRLRRLVASEDWEGIESARGRAVEPHVGRLVALYDELDDWMQKHAVVQLLQDQEDSDEVCRVMLDCLRAPNAHDWSQDLIELSKAVALGFVDDEYDTFMAFYNDRQRLAETVAEVLAAHGLEQEPMPPKPAPEPKPQSTSLMQAIQNGDIASLQEFIDAGHCLDTPRNYGNLSGLPPIIFAIIEDQLEVVDHLIVAGANPHVVRDGGQTALSWAVFKGHTELTRRLIELGGDVAQEDQYGDTLVKAAAQYGYDEILDILIAAGAPNNKPYRDGRTPLWFASDNGKTATALRLIDQGLDINQLISGSAPLHLAVRNNSSRFMSALLKAGADVNLPNDAGRTSLMIAASSGYVNLVKKLLQAGADPTLTDNSGKTAAQLADGRRADEIRALF